MNTSTRSIMVERIARINWQPSRVEPKQALPLIREYLRRCAIWAEALGDKEHWRFLDVAGHLAPEIKGDEAERARLDALLAKQHLSSLIQRLCHMAVRWDEVRQLPRVTALGLPDPFEPLLRFFEIAGAFSVEHGFIDIDGGAFFIKSFAENRNMPVQADVSP